MVPGGPSKGFHNAHIVWRVSHVLSLSTIVPHTSTGGNNELSNAESKCNDPEESEKVEPEDVFSLFLIYNSWQKLISHKCDFAN